MNPLVAAARRYMGVPFRHRGRTAKGVDCVGLGIAAYRDCGVELPDFRLYGPEPQDATLVNRIADALGEPVKVKPVHEADLQVGDVIVLCFYRDPHHVAIVTDYPLRGFAMIHADGHNRKVIEHRLAPDHIARITHVFRRPV